jgi:hypothetical protein
MLEFWGSKEFNLYELESALDNKLDYEIYAGILGEPQASMLKIFVKKLIWFIDEWHNKPDSESHEDIRKTIDKLDAKFRNHRHETGKTYSAKPEY